MNPQDTQNSIGARRKRSPWTAANLSILLAGLGQVYCGDIRRGLAHMWLVGGLLLAATGAIIVPLSWRGSALSILFIALVAATSYSAFSAYRIARRTREDYRLKEYNRPACYAAFVFLFAIPLVGFASLLRANFAEVFVIPTASMQPTIPAGAHVLVRKDSYTQQDPLADDLVAFKNPENRQQTFVKRVVATAGESLEIREGVVWVDGKMQPEAAPVSPDAADFGKITVPPHHCFVLGDNRGNSKDSRHFGTVPYVGLIGKVMLVR